MSGFVIVAARAEHSESIREIHNHVVAHTSAIYDEHPRSTAEQAEWWAGRARSAYPTFVAIEGERVAGHCYFSPFRDRECYRPTAEISLHVAPWARRRGLGRQLLEHLIASGQAAGFHSLMAVIDDANEVSLRLHEELGFQRVGVIPEVARRHGEWKTVVFLQRIL